MIWAFGQELPIWACLVIDIIIGILAGLSWEYLYFIYHGKIHITEGRDGKPDRYLFEFNIEPEIIRNKRRVVFKVVKEKES